MKLNIPIEQTIKKRVSVRTYEEKGLEKRDLEALIEFSKTLSNPFGVKVNFRFIEQETASGGEKLGTYGVIKGASAYVGASVANTEFGLEALGYEFENLILYATHLGIGTVWLAATFSRDRFSSAMGIKESELFPAISPLGYPVVKKRLKENVMRKIMKSDQRKPWNELFFKHNFSTPLTQQEAGVHAQSLEMLRLAPSATNAQPWRIVKDDQAYHFYEAHQANTKDEEKQIKRVDLGIGISHFHQMTLENGLKGHFEKQLAHINEIPPHMDYIISWVLEE